jgi:hypothetical protein
MKIGKIILTIDKIMIMKMDGIIMIDKIIIIMDLLLTITIDGIMMMIHLIIIIIMVIDGIIIITIDIDKIDKFK